MDAGGIWYETNLLPFLKCFDERTFVLVQEKEKGKNRVDTDLEKKLQIVIFINLGYFSLILLIM